MVVFNPLCFLLQTSSLGGGGNSAGAGEASGARADGALYSPVRAHPHPHAHAHPPPEQDIEIFAKDNLNFNKGIFRRKVGLVSLSLIHVLYMV